MSQNIHCTYISEKVNKIRWRPSPLGNPSSFITAGWDNSVNNLRLWEIQPEVFEEDDTDINPYEIKALPLKGDITELKFLNPDQLIASTSQGSVYSLKIRTSRTAEIDISEDITWTAIHSFANGFTSSCTSFAVYDSDIASVGDDGRINLLTIDRETPSRVIDDADSCTMNCCEFLKYNELLTTNIRGQMKIWDLRSDNAKADTVFMLNNDSVVAATCLAHHPTQRHVIIAGDDQGSLTFWDLRQNSYPINVVTSHMEAVSEVHFHPDRPDQIFSCSQAGDVFHWTGLKRSIGLEQEPWYMSAAGANKYDIFTLMPQLHAPVNTLDINRDMLLCGCDNEAMYLIENVKMYN